MADITNQLQAAAGSSSGGATYVIAVAMNFAPDVQAYPVSPAGFGAKFSNPGTAVAGDRARSVAFNRSGAYIAVGSNGSPYIQIYEWSNTTGFGAKVGNPASLPSNQVFGIAWTHADDAIALAYDTFPYVTAYPWTGSSFGTRFSDPASYALNRPVRGKCSFHPNDDAYAQPNITTSPYVNAWAWSGSGFGTKYADPATAPAADCQQTQFSPSGDYLAVAVGTSPAAIVYNWNSSTGFGSKFSDPSATGRPADAYGIAWTYAENAIAVASASTSPYVAVWPWSGSGFGTKFSNPATAVAGQGNCCGFSPDDGLLAVGHNTSPFITVYPWSSGGFGAKIANPATLPTDDVWDLSFNPNPV